MNIYETPDFEVIDCGDDVIRTSGDPDNPVIPSD